MRAIMWEIIFGSMMWWLMLYLLKRRRILPWRSLDSLGPFLILRTSKADSLIERLASPGIWRAFLLPGILLTAAISVFYTVAIIYSDYVIFFLPRMPGQGMSIQDSVLIPGVNRHIPVLWGWIGLIVAVAVHEMGHAIAARTTGVKVGSVGILLPMGAFADVDESELAVQTRIKRTSILSAGIAANFLVAAVSMILFFGPVLGAIVPSDATMAVGGVVPGSQADILGLSPGMIITHINDTAVTGNERLDFTKTNATTLRVLDKGVKKTFRLNKSDGILIVNLLQDYPAEKSGLRVGMRILQVDDVPVNRPDTFTDYMKNTSSGQNVALRVLANGSIRQFNITLSQPPHDIRRGWLGVTVSDDPFGIMFIKYQPEVLLDMLRSLPFEPRGLLYITLLPFLNIIGIPAFGGFTGNLPDLYHPAGWAEPLGTGIFYIANVLFWVGWINLQIALFNSLPIKYLDGGYIFKDWIKSMVKRLTSPEKAETLTGFLTWGITLLLLISLLSALVIPFLK